MNFGSYRFPGRKKPYTQIGISRLKCFRCGNKPQFQWAICANNNHYLPLCLECDIKLNEMVLKFMKFRNWDSLIKEYANKKRYEVLDAN